MELTLVAIAGDESRPRGVGEPASPGDRLAVCIVAVESLPSPSRNSRTASWLRASPAAPDWFVADAPERAECRRYEGDFQFS